MSDPLRTARGFVSSGRFHEALEQLNQLRSELSSSPEWLLLMGMASWRLGQFAESRTAAMSALSEYRSRGDVDGEMRAQNVAAAGAFALGRLSDAREGFERALHLARQVNDKLMMARCANNLGNVAHYRGENDEALQQYRRATSLFEHIGSVLGLAEAWHNIGIVLREQHHLIAAREATDRAMEAAERLTEPRMLGQALGGQGETDALLGDLPLGRVRLERAVELAREHGDRPNEIDNLRVLSYVARQAGESERSLELAHTAADLAIEVNNAMMIAKTQLELGHCFRGLARSGEAAAAYTRAAEALETMGAEPRAQAIREGFLNE